MIEILREAFVNSLYDLSLAQVFLILGVAMALSGVICLIYRLCYRGALFSRSFCISMFATAMITTLLFMAIRSNILLSLGTLGALSIIRFRTAIKEPMDMAFLFFSISTGIICGANMLTIAAIGVLVIGGLLLAVNHLPHTARTYMLVVNTNGADEAVILATLTAGTRRARLKSKSMTGPTAEYIWEVTLPAEGDAVVASLAALDGVTHVSCVKSNTEYI